MATFGHYLVIGPKKILISAAGTLDQQFGGGQVYVQKLARELQRRGRDVCIVCEDPWAGSDERFRVAWRDFHGMPVAGVSTNPARAPSGENGSGQSPPLLEALRQVVANARPDVIHLNGMKPAMTSVAIENSMPHVVTAHHGGIACPAGALLRSDDTICSQPMKSDGCVACFCRQLNAPAPLRNALAALPAWVYRPAGRLLDVWPVSTYATRALMYPRSVEQAIRGKQFVLRQAQQIIAPSRAIAEALIRNGAAESRVNIVPHGIDPLPRVPLGDLQNRPVRFGYVGQIHRAKGVSVLLEAFSGLPAGLAELRITGQPQRPGEQAYLDSAMRPLHGRADVTQHGSVSHDQIAQVMAKIDVLIVPTICLEVFGLVILEAFSVGRPVIVTDSGGPSEIVRNGIDGIVVPPNDAQALSKAMKELAEHPRRIAELAANIRPVRTLAQHVDDIEAFYARVLHAGATDATAAVNDLAGIGA
jgi:glycosyltransferase involved in cell wall biosynthesis